MAGTFLLGAHCDDIAFSLGGALFDGYFGPFSPITVFTVSNYSRRPGSVAAVSRRRQTEDARFFRRVPAAAPSLWLGLLDAPLRLGIEPSATRHQPFPGSLEIAALATTLSRRSLADARVVAPLALGGHVDHRLLRAAALTLPGVGELLFYEDLPYASEMTLAEIRAQVDLLAKELPGDLEPVLLPSRAIADARRWAVRCYSSQVSMESLQRLLLHSWRLGTRELPAERLWRLPRRERNKR